MTNKSLNGIINISNRKEVIAMDDFKRETMVGYTSYDINSKCVRNKSRAKDAKMVKKTARRKAKQKIKEMLDIFIEK